MTIHPFIIALCRDESGAVHWSAAAFFSAVMTLCQAEYREGHLTVLAPAQEVPVREFIRVSGLLESEAVSAAAYIGLRCFPLSLRYTSQGTVKITVDWERVAECFRDMERVTPQTGAQRGLPMLPPQDSTAQSTFPQERYRKILSEYARLQGIQLRQLPQGQISRARASLKRLFRIGVSDEDILRGLQLLHELSRYRLYFRNWSIPMLEQHWQRYVSGDLARELQEVKIRYGNGSRKSSVTETLQMLKEKIAHGH